MKKQFLLLVALVVLLFVTGCGNTSAAEKREKNALRADASKDIVIGAASPWGEKRNLLEHGIRLAVRQINESGGLLGSRKIQVVWGDDERSVSRGQTVAQEFSENIEMTAVIGHSNSYISVPTSIMYQYNGLVMMSPLSTSTRLTAQGYSYIFRNIPNDALLGVKVAEFCKQQKLERVMIYHVSDEFGQGQSNAFEMKAEELGIKIPDRQSYDSFTTDAQIAQDLSYWKESYSFDAIFLAGLMPQAANVIIEVRKAGIDLPILGGDALDHPLLPVKAGKYAENVYTATVFAADSDMPGVKAFTAEFTAEYGREPDIAAAQGYDAVKALAAAITQAGSAAPSKIAEALHNLKDYKGITGEYSFDENGDVSGRNVIMKVVRNGRFEIVQ